MSFRQGARQFFEKRGAPAWTNPYVTDGLVAMWDGEWNAGGGVHDANIGAVNLAGAAELTFPASATYWSMGEKSFDIVLLNDVRNKLTIPANSFNLSEFTVELCSSRLDTSASNAEFGFFVSNCLLIESYAPTAIRARTWNSSGSLQMNYAKTVADTSIPYTLSMTYDGASAKLYYNGSYLTQTTQTFPIFNLNAASVGGLYLMVGGSIYDVRIYNKALTAQNVADNAALDQRRFAT